MKEFMDLHIHTIYSDGDKTPQEILKMAKEIGLTTIAITDHDMIEGLKTLTPDDLKDIEFINGVEMTANVERGRMHILGYGIDINNEYINKKLNNRNDVHNFLLYVEYLKKIFNIQFSQEELDNIINSIGNIGRPDLAKLLIKHNFVKDVDEAFINYLNPVMEACHKEKIGYTKEECLDIIRQAGGIPVLAHPISLKMDEEHLTKEIAYLKDKGLGGIETRHIHLSPDYTNMLEKIANNYHLLTTGGTDYHGSIKPSVKLGTGINGNIRITSSTLVDYLRAEKQQKIKCKKI